MPVARDELCFVNAKAGLGLLFNVFEQSNQDGIINSLSIVNKTKMPITIQCGQQGGSLHLVETVNILGDVFISSLSSLTLDTLNKVSSSYFFVYLSFNFFLFTSFSESKQECWMLLLRSGVLFC